MRSVSVELDPRALLDATEAKLWFLSHRPHLVEAFQAEIDEALEAIGRTPLAWPKYTRDLRRYITKRLRYNVLYALDGSIARILVIAHYRRDLGTLKTRLL